MATEKRKARIRIAPGRYRDRQGFNISGIDLHGRRVRIFTESRGSAEQIRERIREGLEIRVQDFSDPAVLQEFRTREVNPRYLAYCAAHGETDPDAMLERDRKRWPGGLMCGFICWIQERWQEWRELNSYPSHAPIGPAEHASFDAWLAEQVRS